MHSHLCPFFNRYCLTPILTDEGEGDRPPAAELITLWATYSLIEELILPSTELHTYAVTLLTNHAESKTSENLTKEQHPTLCRLLALHN